MQRNMLQITRIFEDGQFRHMSLYFSFFPVVDDGFRVTQDLADLYEFCCPVTLTYSHFQCSLPSVEDQRQLSMSPANEHKVKAEFFACGVLMPPPGRRLDNEWNGNLAELLQMVFSRWWWRKYSRIGAASV